MPGILDDVLFENGIEGILNFYPYVIVSNDPVSPDYFIPLYGSRTIHID